MIQPFLFLAFIQTLETVKRSVVDRGWREGRINKESTEIFRAGHYSVRYNNVDTCPHAFVKAHGLYTKSELNVN